MIHLGLSFGVANLLLTLKLEFGSGGIHLTWPIFDAHQKDEQDFYRGDPAITKRAA